MTPFGSPGCKWPVEGDGAEMLCCGAERLDGRPYCEPHNQASIAPPKPGKPKPSVNELIRSLRRWAA